MRVLVVDDQLLFRDAVCALLRERGAAQIVGQASSAREAYAQVRQEGVDLVMLELVLPGVDGVAAAREIRRLQSRCKILVVTGCLEPHRLHAAWAAGVDGCLTKHESADVMLSAIAELAAGRRYLSPTLRRSGETLRVVGEPLAGGGHPLAALSQREREVVDLIVRGFSTKAAASELCISSKTVETHRTHINDKLNVHSTADLVRFALRNGLLLPLGAREGHTPPCLDAGVSGEE
ncbi:MAG: response regulator transcription factor [Polyangia bacterium]|jgi:two-component system response regulator NreC